MRSVSRACGVSQGSTQEQQLVLPVLLVFYMPLARLCFARHAFECWPIFEAVLQVQQRVTLTAILPQRVTTR